ncbi:MAG: DUF1275 family protein [Phycisphaeraceae bacterium]|nr:MAG: DUF1275 family protein [Phycisphaeraceae bacterium]
MFVAQAHSFTQQARLAITLAWIAGYTNILGILTCGHVLSHVSGTASDLGRHGAEGKVHAAGFALYLLLTFALGAALSGFTTELGRRRGWDSIYVVPMILQTLLLSGFAAGVNLHEMEVPESGVPLYVMTGLASAAMGLQNATITRISGGVVRTTHVTGVLTDLGSESAGLLWFLRDRTRERGWVGRLARDLRLHAGARRVALLASILGSFVLGAALGTLAYDHFPRPAMFPPVLFLLWIIAQDLRTPIAEIEPSELVRDSGFDLPAEIAVFRLRKDASRRGAVQRLPDLSGWLDRLPRAARVIVLDLDEVNQLDTDSASELNATITRANQAGRRIVLAGVTPEQYRDLACAGGDQGLDPLAAVPHIEFAIARALLLLEELRAADAE